MIKAENINYVYSPGMPSEHQAIYDVSLEIEDGTINAIIGHTGSGKSTLVQHFNALIKPTSGRILIDDVDVTSLSTDILKIRQKVGLVFQYPEHQLFEETVEKDIAFGPKNLGLNEEEIKQRVKMAAKMTGLNESHLLKSPFELSGGEKRRAAIAGVIAMAPRVLILDEPTAGLDPKGRDEILELIKKLHRENPQMIIIFVSHSMEDVAKTADKVFVMNKGRLWMSGSVSEIFSRGDELKEIGLNVPQITEVCNRLRAFGYDIPEEIYTVTYAAQVIEELIKNNQNGERNV